MYASPPFFRLSLTWIIGVVLALRHPIDIWMVLIMLMLLGLLYLGAFIAFRYSTRKLSLFKLNVLGVLLTIFISYGNVLLHIGKKEQTHFAKFSTPKEHVEGYYARIEKVYSSSSDLFSCKATVTHTRNNSGWHNSVGIIQLYFSKKTGYKPQKGDCLLVHGTPIAHLLNNQKNIKSIFCSLFAHPLYSHPLKKLDKDFMVLMPQYTRNWSETIRQWCSKTLKEQVKEQQTVGMVEALLFGQKDNLSASLRQAYADTGTIHVLAVSGLHVGMLLLLTASIFKCLFRSIGCAVLVEFLILIVLWVYAWLCNFAPPILRATIMITIAKSGLMLQRSSNTYNALFASAFVLLLWDPLLLLNWGFQLSYMATLGIIYLHPRISGLITIKNSFIQKIWITTSLSAAAQISTIPLILHYFNRFPLYFIIANWLAVPAIFAILALSIAMIAVSRLPVINTVVSFMLTKLVLFTNTFVFWVAQWPFSTLSNLSISIRSVYLLYLILICICLFFRYKHLVYLVIVNLCIAFYAIDQIKYTITVSKECRVCFRHNNALIFELENATEKLIYHDPPLNSKLDHVASHAGCIIASWHGKIILSVKDIPSDWYIWNSPKLDVDYLLIEQRLLDDLDVLLKVCSLKRLIVYGNQSDQTQYFLKYRIKKLGIPYIWLKPGEKKALAWSIIGENSAL